MSEKTRKKDKHVEKGNEKEEKKWMGKWQINNGVERTGGLFETMIQEESK